jgi:hypothetical protein
MEDSIVPAHDPRCDVCAGKKNRPRPKPGERHSEREVVRTMCQACYDEFMLDQQLGRKLHDPLNPDRLEPPDHPENT